jgi:hypothetical protein
MNCVACQPCYAPLRIRITHNSVWPCLAIVTPDYLPCGRSKCSVPNTWKQTLRPLSQGAVIFCRLAGGLLSEFLAKRVHVRSFPTGYRSQLVPASPILGIPESVVRMEYASRGGLGTASNAQRALQQQKPWPALAGWAKSGTEFASVGHGVAGADDCGHAAVIPHPLNCRYERIDSRPAYCARALPHGERAYGG